MSVTLPILTKVDLTEFVYIAIGLAAFGGSLGQGKAAAAGLEAMGRNPNASLMAPFIVGLALIESLVIYGLLIAFQLVGKI